MTHVLLDVRLAARRADAAEVIAEAVEKKVVAGWGHRKVAEWLGRPASTVRGWLRVFAGSASRIQEWFTSVVLFVAPDAVTVWPAPCADAPAAAVSALLAYAAGLGQRFRAVGTVAWVRAGVAATNGRLFSAGFWVAGVQHELVETRHKDTMPSPAISFAGLAAAAEVAGPETEIA